MSDEAVLETNPSAQGPDSNQAAGSTAEQVTLTSVEELAARLQAAEQKASDNWDQLLRTRAEMENLRRRTQRDLENAHKYALEKFAAELLPVKDSLELGLDAAKQNNANIEKLCEGTELTLSMLANALAKFNVVELNPKGGKIQSGTSSGHGDAAKCRPGTQHRDGGDAKRLFAERPLDAPGDGDGVKSTGVINRSWPNY